MKTWFEFPESTRFARTGRADILYTPIYFANEGIKAHFCLDNEWAKTYDDFSKLRAEVRLIGKASLGFLSIGGRPVSTFDTRYALPSVGFRPIYTLTIMEKSKQVQIEDGVDNRTPFEFRIHTATLDDLQQLASSLKVVTADTNSTMDLFHGISPALIVSVQYALVGTLHYEGEKKSEHDSEIRIFTSLAEGQVPIMGPDNIGNNPLAGVVQTGLVSLAKQKVSTNAGRRRDSLPLIRRLSRSGSASTISKSSSSIQESYLVVEAEALEPFVFKTRDEAAAIRVRISLTYHDDNNTIGEEVDGSDDNPPPPISANLTALLKSLTSLTLEPMNSGQRDEEGETEHDEYFHLRSKILPLKKMKATFGEWKKTLLTSTALIAAQNRVQAQTESQNQGDSNNTSAHRRASTTPLSPTAQRDTFNTETTREADTQNTGLESNSSTIPTSLSRSTTLPTTSTTAPPEPQFNPPPPMLTILSPPKRWTTTADLWLTHPITTTLTPSFVTPYISHLYTLQLSINLSADLSSTSSSSSTSAAKSFRSLKSGFGPSKPAIELNVPVQVRYDLGLVPSYEVDGTLPEYDYSLPLYEDAVGLNPGAAANLAASSTPGLGAEVDNGESQSTRDARVEILEPDHEYEARITAGAEQQREESQVHHAWRHANVDGSSAALAMDEDDDVLEMLMRRSGVAERGAPRRIYGDAGVDGN